MLAIIDYDYLWDGFWRILPKYANSHMYDITAYCCGLIGFLVMFFFKIYIKKFNRRHAEKRFGQDISIWTADNSKAMMLYRRMNLLIPFLAGFVSMSAFGFIASCSKKIHIQTYWLPITGLIPIAIFTLYEQLKSGWIGRIICALIFILLAELVALYCSGYNPEHLKQSNYKICYVLKNAAVVFGILGILGQLFWKRKVASKDEKPVAAETHE